MFIQGLAELAFGIQPLHAVSLFLPTLQVVLSLKLISQLSSFTQEKFTIHHSLYHRIIFQLMLKVSP